MNNGVTVVKAAGNDNQDAYQDRANRANGAIIVGATDRTDGRAYYCCGEASNYGPTLSLFAPGYALAAASNASDYGSVSFYGTSGAAPLLAGVAAITLQHYPGSSPATIKTLIVNNASNVYILNAGTSPNKVLCSRIP